MTTILLFCLTTITLKGQAQCKVTELQTSDTLELKRMWNELRKAVESKNKLEMSKFFSFPFYSAPIIDGINDSSTVLVTRKTFFENYYKVLLLRNFIELLEKRELLDLLVSDFKEDGTCIYNISSLMSKNSKKSGGNQVFMSLKKIKTKYKFISIWTIP